MNTARKAFFKTTGFFSTLGLGILLVFSCASGGGVGTSAAPRNLKAPPEGIGDSRVFLVWEKGGGETDYEVFCNNESAGFAAANVRAVYPYLSGWIDSFYAGTAQFPHYAIRYTSFTAKDLNADTDYAFKVRALFSDGTVGPFSKTLKVHTAKKSLRITGEAFGVTALASPEAAYFRAGAGGNSGIIRFVAENTAALQRAVDAVPPGGTLFLAGTGDNSAPVYYVSGSLFLHSRMTVEIAEGAVLLGSPVFDHYPRNLLVYPYSQDIRTYGIINALNYDETAKLTDIRLVGSGIIDGNGWTFADKNPQDRSPLDAGELPGYFAGNNRTVKERGILAADAMVKSESDAVPNSAAAKWYNSRPNLIVMRGVSGLLYEGLTFRNPAFHGIVNYQSDHITQAGTILQTFNANNGDGIEFGDCRDIIVMNNFFDTGDDSINFAAGQGASVRNSGKRVASGEGRIFNNYLRNGHGGLIAAGSHTGGFIGDLTAEDNVYHSAETGSAGVLRIKSGATTGGGVRNILFRDNALHYSLSGGPVINIDGSYSDSNASTAFSPESEVATTFENIAVKNLTITGVLGSPLFSAPKPGDSVLAPRLRVRGITVEDIRVLQSGTDKNGGAGGGIEGVGLEDALFRNITYASPPPPPVFTDCSRVTVTKVDGAEDAFVAAKISEAPKKTSSRGVVTFDGDSVTLGVSGISWIDLRWTNAVADSGGIAYYRIDVRDDGGNAKTYKVLYDRPERSGYSLWGLKPGTAYSAVVTAVSSGGSSSLPSKALSFTTVPGTVDSVPKWKSGARVLVHAGSGGTAEVSWKESDVDTSAADGIVSEFAGYRVFVDGVPVQNADGTIDSANAYPLTTAASVVIPTPPAGSVVSVEAGYRVLKIASGGGPEGSTGFTGTANTDLPRNQVTFGKWSNHGPRVTVKY